jgi:hypothetical protein
MIALRVRMETVKGLKRFNQTFPAAIARGLNEGGDKVRTRVQRALKEQTGVKAYSSITKRVKTLRAHAGGLSYQIVATGKGIPIKEFPVKSSVHAPVTANVWNIAHTFKRSFTTSGKGLLRARLGASRMPIRAFYGPALPKELGKGQSAQTFYASAAEFVPPAILKHLAKAM